ncbi:uncharacterized protein MYCFIDRAFT_206374 [Pseudocercospora fijiensis CIRAD86]|uniref:Asl1-like glycosyl hydrolase catalytic domain-containing protein n=1 Tax=Pseudocercospora fijiensis (strain CIRAD86) TaxID=383855 RepID=N1QBJ4_PSEFD|nr:uncharacterized protein MYCFIDRAFT_206374 [Pseudocercospora fijiensis CIRAD86]EME89501.1 hypothetical protein MYCFIDRAFT_206374 [Pseudocercospora fijiensis CIRAD86]
MSWQNFNLPHFTQAVSRQQQYPQHSPSTKKTPLPPPPLSKSKRGLCWPVENQDPIHIFTKPGSKISWIYNWSPTPTPSPNPSSLEFIPMQWNHINIEHLPKILESSPSPYVLTFNEPDLPSQANMSPELAADQFVFFHPPSPPLTDCIFLSFPSQGYRIGSPSISNSPDGAQWLSTFLQYIRTPPPSEPGEKLKSDIDFLCLHWYGETLGQFYDYIWATYVRPFPSLKKKNRWFTFFFFFANAHQFRTKTPLPRPFEKSLDYGIRADELEGNKTFADGRGRVFFAGECQVFGFFGVGGTVCVFWSDEGYGEKIERVGEGTSNLQKAFIIHISPSIESSSSHFIISIEANLRERGLISRVSQSIFHSLLVYTILCELRVDQGEVSGRILEITHTIEIEPIKEGKLSGRILTIIFHSSLTHTIYTFPNPDPQPSEKNAQLAHLLKDADMKEVKKGHVLRTHTQS